MAIVLHPGTELGAFGAHLVNEWAGRRAIAVRYTVWVDQWERSMSYRRGIFDKLEADLHAKAGRERLSLLSLGPVFAMPNSGTMPNEVERQRVRSTSDRLPGGPASFTFERKALAIPLHQVD